MDQRDLEVFEESRDLWMFERRWLSVKSPMAMVLKSLTQSKAVRLQRNKFADEQQNCRIPVRKFHFSYLTYFIFFNICQGIDIFFILSKLRISWHS